MKPSAGQHALEFHNAKLIQDAQLTRTAACRSYNIYIYSGSLLVHDSFHQCNDCIDFEYNKIP